MASPAQPLAGQVALVTGASRGIGLAIARRLGQMGAKLSLCSRDGRKMSAAAMKMEAEGILVFHGACDVTQPAEIEAWVRRTRESLGPIDILVNNAGVGVFRPAQELSEEQWDQVMNTNLKGVWLFSRAVALQMIERRTGHIINISSLAGINTFANGGVYCASKWGLQALTACMGEDLRGYGIRVSAVCPGSVHTEFSPHAGKDPQRMLQPDDIAHAVAMLVTQAPQSYISEIHMRPTHKP